MDARLCDDDAEEGNVRKLLMLAIVGISALGNSPLTTRVAAQVADDSQRSKIGALKCPGERRGLVISGGGVRGAYEVGAIWYLVNVLNCDFDRILGTSTGAIAAAILAQAKTHDELKAQVNLLKAEYESLTKTSDIADERNLGLVRFALPKWLGGVDGAATLAPLEARLRKEVTNQNVPEKLTIMAVSLQAGALDPDWFRVDNIFDLVIGSASMPIAIEPRRARVWTRARPLKLEDSVLSVNFYVAPGLPDPDCELKISQTRFIKCELIPNSTKVYTSELPRTTRIAELLDDDVGSQVSTAMQLKLSGLSNDDRTAINKSIDYATGPLGAGVLFTTSPIRRIRIFKAPAFEFTMIHQIVDGGVTDNTPLAEAIKYIGEPKIGVDFIVALLAGRSSVVDKTVSEVHGAHAILTRNFSRLWESYQYQAFRASERYLAFYKSYCDAFVKKKTMRSWRKELEEKIGVQRLSEIDSMVSVKLPPDLTDWREDEGIVSDFCERAGYDKWTLWTIDPGKTGIEGTLSVQPSEIKVALLEGCDRAAFVAFENLAGVSQRDYFTFEQKARAYSKDACEPLARQQ
jgi:predicted acylesterase/phospholipase RssA